MVSRLDWDRLIRPTASALPPIPTVGKGTVPRVSSGYGPGAAFGSSARTPFAEQERALQSALRNAEKRIGTDPNAERERDRLLTELRSIAGGKDADNKGVLGLVGKVAGKGLEGLGYVLGRPLAVVASAGKEISDIASGQASWEDFFKQTVAKDTSVSKYLPKSGNKWLDGIIGFVGDVALDPLTYVTFGASAYAGRAGRLALAAKAAEKGNLEKIPSLIAKVNDGSIARLGEWALTAAEKEALGIQSGVSWAFRSKGVIGKPGTALGKVSEKTAAVVGKPFAAGRARIGDVPIFRPVQRATSAGSAKTAKLDMYGRAKEAPDAINAVARLGSYSATARANGAGRLMDARFGSRGQELVKNISKYEADTGRRIFQVVEGTRTAADDVEQNLADSVRQFLSELREESNRVTSEVANRRDIAAYGIGEIDNYIPHTLTQEAKDWIAANYPNSIGRTQSNLRKMLDMSPDEFRKGAPITRARTLESGGTWLGEPLKSKIPGTELATMDEINAISRNKLNFNWFEEDGAQYISNYLDSIVSQTKRVAYLDRLFDYGPDVIRKYSQRVIPNNKLRKQFQRTIDIIDSLTDDLLDDYVRFAGGDVEDLLAPRLALAQDIADSRPGDAILSPERVASIRSTITKAIDSMAEADGVAGSLPAELREGYETIMAPVRARINSMRGALEANDQEGLAALVGLRELYQRVFPDADLIPSDPRALAEDIIDGVSAMRGGYTAAQDLVDELATTAERTARGLELPVPGGAVYGTPEEGRQAVANLENLLRQNEQNLQARIGLGETIAGDLEGQSAATAARQRISELQGEIGDIRIKRDSDIAQILGPQFEDLVSSVERKFTETTPQQFLNSIGEAGDVVKNGQRVGDTLTIYGLDEYNGMRVFLSPDGKSGYAVKPDGDLVSVFNVGQKGMGEEAVFDAILFSGATKLDAFDQNGFLPNMYRKFGFKEVDRLQWDWQYAPPKWTPEMGEPDVVFMELDERIKRYVSQPNPAAQRLKADTRTRILQGEKRTPQGLPRWVPSGLRDRLDNSARGGIPFGGTTPPRRTGLGTRTSRVEKDVKNIRVSAARRTARRQQEVNKLQAVVDAVTPLDVARDQWDAGVGSVYRESIDKITRVAAERPAGDEAAASTARWLAKTARTMDAVNAPGLGLSPVERDVLERVLLASKGMEAELADLEMARSFNVAQLDRAIKGDLAKVVDDTIRGWEKITQMGVQMPPEVRDLMFDRVRLLKDPKEASKFAKMYDAYTKFFKVTAMLTPGFIVRNSYTASFNNFVAGVTLPETLEGLRFATSMWKNGLDNALEKVPAKKRGLYERALQVAYSSGAGQTADDILAPVLSKRGDRLLNMRGIKQWSQANETAEIAARFSLALSSLKRGMDYDAALNQVSRYHFDYSDLSSFDETMRRWIPFWTFASRNIPLQLINQAARPGMYRRYEALRRNFGVSEEDQTVFPQWLAERQPLQFPGMAPGGVVNPDLPFIDMQEQMRMFSDPMRLLSQANPLVKLPIELAGGRQLYQNIPFKQEKVDVRGPLDLPALLAGLVTGGGGRRPDGSYFTTSRAAYAVPNLLPSLGQLQRMIPQLGGKESYQDRQSSSFASYVGLPYRRVPVQEQTNELTRRQFAIKNYLSELTRRGLLTPKEQ